MRFFSGVLMRLFLPLNDPRAGSRVARLYSKLERTQWLERLDLERLQEEKLSSLIDRIAHQVPYFREYRPLPSGEKELRENLASYPIMTKETIRSKKSAIHPVSGLPFGATRATTGGTTGEPLEVWFGRERRASVLAAYWRGLCWLGIRPWTRGLRAGAFGGGSWYGTLRMRLTNQRRVDLFGRSREELMKIARAFREIRPAYIEGFVSNLLELGEACSETGVRIPLVVTTGEMLYDYQRNQLEGLFSARVSEYYGSNEVGAIAFECEYGNKHISDEHVIVEVVDDDGKHIWDQAGRILVTDLNNGLTPFVRYEVGDIGVVTRERCPCGRGLTVLKTLEGRMQDAIRNGAGERLTALFFAGRFRHMESLRRIQIVQTALNSVEINYENATADARSDLGAIEREIHERLGAQMIVRWRQVPALSHTHCGKCRLVIGLDGAQVAAS